ncbi:MAG: class I SAM-dependent methyltransferase [Actinomycetes bacterium]
MSELTRLPEPELMDTPEQVSAYAAADFSVPHQALVTKFAELFPDFGTGLVLDIGCGAADVTARFALQYPEAQILGVDAGPEMLRVGVAHIASLGLSSRVTLHELHIPDARLEELGPFDAFICNSLLHHLAEPSALWESLKYSASGAPVFVQDLRRPYNQQMLEAFVEIHTEGFAHELITDFHNSLWASYTAAEVREQLTSAGLTLTVEEIGDRHLIVYGRL